MTIAMTIGENISRLRDKTGVTQLELADEIGVSPVMIHHYERGLKTPRVEILIRIAEYFKITPNDLIYGERKIS